MSVALGFNLWLFKIPRERSSSFLLKYRSLASSYQKLSGEGTEWVSAFGCSVPLLWAWYSHSAVPAVPPRFLLVWCRGSCLSSWSEGRGSRDLTASPKVLSVLSYSRAFLPSFPFCSFFPCSRGSRHWQFLSSFRILQLKWNCFLPFPLTA